MTVPISTVDTSPFCGACGYDVVASGDTPSGEAPQDAKTEPFCSACGADIQAFNFTPLAAIEEAAAQLVAPAQDATKTVLLAWLADQGVTGVDSLTKAELWDLINDLLD